MREFIHQRQKFRNLSFNSKQIWTVIYTNSSFEDLKSDIQISLEEGADLAVIEGQDLDKITSYLSQLIEVFPSNKIGLNILGPDDNLYRYKESFKLAQKFNLPLVWTDFSGVDLIKEAPEVSLHEIDSYTSDSIFYVSGIHMKYSTLLDSEKPIEKSALQAMGWVDGIVLTSKKTAQFVDVGNVKKVRKVVGDYPIGVASGVSAQNITQIKDLIDFVLVNSSISDSNHRILKGKVSELRKVFN